jgi:hypothetical protein
VATSRQDLVDGLIAARARHAHRSPAVRAAQVLAGLVLLVLGAAMAIVLPEAGVPSLLIALRVLADEFDWAARAYGSIAWQWERLRAWLVTQPGGVRALVILAGSLVAIVLIAILA